MSATFHLYLRPWCETRRLEYICTMLEEREGRLTRRCIGGACSGAEKARRILERFTLSRYEVVYAYGTTDEDREMLALAHRRFYRGREIDSR